MAAIMTHSEQLERKLARFSPDQIESAVQYFQNWGYVILTDAFPVAQGNAFWGDLERAMAQNTPLTCSAWGQLYTYPDVPLEAGRFPRVVDAESHVPSSRELMLAPPIVKFLEFYYSGLPTCLQTLTYKYSSEQGAHSDKTLVSPPAASDYDRETLTASWIALEDSDETNGALIVYPGSHKLRKRGFFDGFGDDYGRYSSYVHELCVANDCAPVTYRAHAGEVLFWHGDFVHAGGPIKSRGEVLPTRRSLVCHYARLPQGYESRDPVWKRVGFGGAFYFEKT
jgi:hypothetical protein